MKILLVDDDSFLRDMYATKFIECGHEVVASVQAADALRVLEQDSSFDLILVDMIMPAMTGVELMREVRERLTNVKSHFIVLSNQGQEQDVAEAKEAGAIGYIIKAQSVPSEVVKKVEEIIAKL